MQACFYCGEVSKKIARHYYRKYADEKEVAVALSFKTRSAERKTHLDKSTVRCNNHHNMTVLETACEGELIVVRRPSSGKPCSADDFLPCSFCLGFIRRQEWRKYTASCPFRPEDDEPEREQKVQANFKIMIMAAITHESNSMLNQVMASMRMDDISLVARNNPLIKKVGMVLIH